MATEDTKEYRVEEQAEFAQRLAQAEELSFDTFDPDLERHRQRWQARQDKVLAQIAAANSPDYKELLGQKLSELEQAWKRSSENLAALRQMHGITD